MIVNVPISHSVNVLIIGMSSGAVSAAAAAREAGASVLCVSRTTFPGEDIASPMRYWPELSDDSTPLTRALFASGADCAPSPMHVKYTLERVLLDCGAAIRYMSYPAFLLRDESGVLCGAVIANRSGFEAVLAGTIIDATARAVVARMGSAPFAPWCAGPQTFTRTVLTKTPVDSLAVRAMPTPMRFETGEVSAFEYSLTIDMPDSSPVSFGRAEVAARLATWDPTMLWAADELFHVPQDRYVAAGTAAAYSPGAGFEDTAGFTCETGRLFILGPCASVSDDAARALCSPEPLMVLGEQLGTLAAATSASQGETKSVTVDYRGVAPCDGFDIVRRDRYFRLENAANIEVDLNRLAAIGGFDVVVAGGGTAGAGAGISAAHDGSATLVAEYLSGLGGVSTEGRICSYYHGNRVGFTAYIDIGVHEMAPGCEFPAGSVNWNPEWKKQWYLRAAANAGAEVWFGAMSVAAAVCGERVCGVALATPYAPVGLVTAKTVVDATGNADIAAAAGAQVVVISRAHVAVQGSGLPPVIPGRHYTNTDYTFIDDCDVADVSAAFIRSREKFKTQFDLAQIIDSRQRRQVRGDVSLDVLDFLAGRTFPDTVTVSRSNFDSHGFTIHPVFVAKAPDTISHDAHVPLRALLPRGLEGVLVTGLGVSAHRDALPVIRMQPDVQNQGYAAGLAASMAAKNGGHVRAIDIRALQRHLVLKGFFGSDILAHQDSFPLDSRVVAEAAGGQLDDHRSLAVVFAQPEISRPALVTAFAACVDPKRKLRLALVLGLMGDSSGAHELLKVVEATAWDTGWRYRGMGQFGFSLSPLDAMIIALSRTGERACVPVLLAKLAALSAESEFSHLRAITLAFENMPSADAAPKFAALMDSDILRGNSRSDVSESIRKGVTADPVDTSERNRELAELMLARGLVACGDWNAKGRAVLKAYSSDLHGHYARHARAILAGAPTESEQG